MNNRRLTGNVGALDGIWLLGVMVGVLIGAFGTFFILNPYGSGGQGEMAGLKVAIQDATIEGDTAEVDDESFSALGKWMYLNMELTNTTDDNIDLNHEYELFLNAGDGLLRSGGDTSSSLNVGLTEKLNDIQDLKSTELEPGETVEIVGVFDWGNTSQPGSLIVSPENSIKRLHIPLERDA